MGKSSKTKPTFNQQILEELKNKYDVTRRYIDMSINGERNGTLSIAIKEDYEKLCAAARIAIKEKSRELNP